MVGPGGLSSIGIVLLDVWFSVIDFRLCNFDILESLYVFKICVNYEYCVFFISCLLLVVCQFEGCCAAMVRVVVCG